VIGVILTFLCYDLPWAIAGLRNVVEIVSEPGTLNNATDPAAVSMASVMGTLSTQDVSRTRSRRCCWPPSAIAMRRRELEPGFGAGCSSRPIRPASRGSERSPTRSRAPAGRARSPTEIDSGGIFHSMGSRMSNAETVEARVPALLLYRRELCDGGGAGRFRGGAAVEFGSIPHKLPDRSGRVRDVRRGCSACPRPRALGRHPGAATSM